VLSAILILLVLGVALVVLLWVGTAVLQSYLYTESPPDLYWRAPVAGLALALFVAFWWLLANRYPGQIGALHEFGAGTQVEHFPELIWVRKDPADDQRFVVVKSYRYDGPKKKYLDKLSSQPWTRSTSDGMVEWLRANHKEGDETDSVLFKAELKSDGTFKDPTTYVEQGGKGRVMTEAELGSLSSSKSGQVFVNLLLNGAFLVAWFLCLWLLLRFQWLHALGLSVAMWLALILTIVPLLLNKGGG
jgi:hypothetical protein